MKLDNAKDEAAEDPSDTSRVSQHTNSNDDNNIVSSPYPRQDDDSNKEDKIDFSTFLKRNDFGYLKKPFSDKLKITTV